MFRYTPNVIGFASHRSVFLWHQYEQFTDTIRNAMSFHIDNVMLSHQHLAERIAATAIATNQTWPFVTIPHYEVDAAYCRQASGAEMIAFNPIISQDDVDEWIPYSIANQGWLTESREIMKNSGKAGTLTLSSYLDGDVAPLIYEFADEGAMIGIPSILPPYVPVWYVELWYCVRRHLSAFA
jgi:hypothetical protein